MKKLLFFSVFVMLILINSCKSPLGLDDVLITQGENQYFPTATGNYWIYENITDSLTTIDSVVVTGKKNIEGYNADEFTTFRNGRIYSVNYYMTDRSKVYLYSKVLEPLLDTINAEGACYCPLEMSWKPIVKFDELWQLQVKSTGDKYRALLTDSNSPSGYNAVTAMTEHTLLFNGSKGSSDEVKLENSIIDSYKYKIQGHWYYGIDTTSDIGYKNIDFSVIPGYRYINSKTVIVQDMNVDIQFSKNIGIVKTEGSIIDTKSQRFIQNRNLLRYKVN